MTDVKYFRTAVGYRGRVTLAAFLREEAGIKEGDEVIIRVVRPGVIAVETPQAVKDKIRSGVPGGLDTAALDAVADVQELRGRDG